MSKRIMAYINWRLPVGRGPLARAKHHDMGLLNRIFEDIRTQNPDHCVLTGDLVNFSLSSEFRRAAEYLKILGDGEHLTCVPGNHDAYVTGAEIHWGTFLSPWMHGDSLPASQEKLHFPFVRMRGPLAFIGLSSAIPTHPLASYGALGNQQREEAQHILEDLGRKGIVRIVLIHHPPHLKRHLVMRKILSDSQNVQSLLKSTGAELVLHGHTHKASVAYIMPHRSHLSPIPILGVPSASANYDSPLKRAGYNLIDFSRENGGKIRWTISGRSIDASGHHVMERTKMNIELKGKFHE